MKNNTSILNNQTIKQLEQFNHKCSGCGLCTKYCALHIHNRTNPKSHTRNLLKNHDNLELLNTSYNCTTCGYCQIRCPKGLDYKAIHINIKETLYKTQKQLPNPSAEKIVTLHQNTMFTKFFNHATTGFTREDHRKVFFPGCALIGAQPETVLSTYEYLQKQNDNIGIMSYCCGKPTQTIGKTEAFALKFETIKAQVALHNIEEIITACPNCHMTLKKNLPDIKITHISQSILTYGLPKHIRHHKNTSKNPKIAIHDPCPIRYEIEIHIAVRDILNMLGFIIRERSHTMEHTLCCGSGAMLRLLSPSAAEKYTAVFLNEFEDDEPIVTYCQECVNSLNNHQQTAHHLLNILFSPHYSLETESPNVSTLKKWTNRYTYKTKITLKKGLF